MKKYTMWRIDSEYWLLEIDDEKLGNYIKSLMEKEPPAINVERFGVGINIPLRVFKVKDIDIEAVEAILSNVGKRGRKKKNG